MFLPVWLLVLRCVVMVWQGSSEIVFAETMIGILRKVVVRSVSSQIGEAKIVICGLSGSWSDSDARNDGICLS